jgi:hypothetical protein
MGYLLRREFRLAFEFHAPALRGLHSGVGPFAYESVILSDWMRQSWNTTI